MHRALVALLVLPGVAVTACTTFDFPAPSTAPSDAAATDATLTGDAPDAPVDGSSPPAAYLDTDDAARLCSLLFQCPHLDDAIALSIALPLDDPSPLNFAACMDWVAGPIDPGRLGLMPQRALLSAVAAATSCAAAGAALPVQPATTGSTCGLTCPTGSELSTCSADAGTYVLPCQPPYFGQAGACFATDAGATCVSTGSCPTGLSCSSDETSLIQCFPPGYATFVSYDCTLTARQCFVQAKGGGLADCVIPGHNTAPCPLHDRRDACDGTSVLACAGGLAAQTEFDCNAVNRTCRISSALDARCVGAADKCTPFDTGENACSGTMITVCIGGVPSSYDCSSIGKSCVAGAAGQTAHCG
ncbi:MAG: hypothetical protein ABSE49_03090 [Polyangiaceae bacterium]|jgi:hypothetical protein